MQTHETRVLESAVNPEVAVSINRVQMYTKIFPTVFVSLSVLHGGFKVSMVSKIPWSQNWFSSFRNINLQMALETKVSGSSRVLLEIWWNGKYHDLFDGDCGFGQKWPVCIFLSGDCGFVLWVAQICPLSIFTFVQKPLFSALIRAHSQPSSHFHLLVTSFH